MAFFVALWIVSSLLISLWGGWHTLATRFTQQSAIYGETRTAGPLMHTVYMRFWCRYSGVVRMTETRDALYLSVLFPFRIGHPPLCIPWSEITFSRTRYFWQQFVALTLGSEERIPLRISERMAGKLGILERLPRSAATDGRLPG